MQDARGNVTTTTSDIWGRVVSVTPPTGPGVTYTYDIGDQLLTAIRGGLTTTLTYDKAGRKTSMTDPDMGYWTYDYDALGNLTSQTDARNCTLTLTYDILSRPDTKTSSGSCGVQISVDNDYDDIENGNKGLGRRTSMTDASGSTAWTYDERGRVLTETKTITGGGSFVTAWDYNSADLPKWMRYPDGEQVTYEYNNRMLLETLSGAANYMTGTTYDAAGRVTSRLLGNGSGR